MRILKKVLSSLFIITMVLVIASCANEKVNSVIDEVPQVEGRVFKDDLNREVTIPKEPKRVLALTSAIMQAFHSVDVELVGKVEEYQIDEALIALPSVGAIGNINMEAILALEPDLIIASSRHHGALEEQLEQIGATVYFMNPEQVGEVPILELSMLAGEIMNKEDAANAYVQSVRKQSAQLANKIAAQTDIKTGIILAGGDAVKAAQKASGYGSILTLLEIENVLPPDLPNAQKAAFVDFSAEALVEADPDIVLIRGAGQKGGDGGGDLVKAFVSDPKWQGLSAVKNGQVFLLPGKINPSRMSIEDMVKVTAKIILGE